MYRKSNFDDPQAQAYLRYAGDGIADMIVGVAFLGIGLMMFSDLPFVPIWIVLLLAPLSWGLKRWITVPRLSEAELLALSKEEGPAVQTIKAAAIVGVLLLTSAVLLTTFASRWLPGIPRPALMWALIGVTLVTMLLILGLIYRSWRWAAYAVLVLPAMALLLATAVDFPAVLAGLGAVILLGGLVVCGRFLSTHPPL
jgi:hypothetical protein